MLLLFKLLLNFFHFLADTFVRTDVSCFKQHFDTEDEEETGCEEVGDVFGD